MKYLIALLLFTGSVPSFSCDEISGVYKSVSETHWNYIISISGRDLNVNFSTYWYGGEGKKYGEDRFEVNSDYTGYCDKQGNEYVLKFDNKNVVVKFYEKLSLKELGEERHLSGISGVFFGESEINLWKFN